MAVLSTTTMAALYASSNTDLLTYLGTVVPYAFGTLIVIISVGWGIYLFRKYTNSRGKKI